MLTCNFILAGILAAISDLWVTKRVNNKSNQKSLQNSYHPYLSKALLKVSSKSSKCLPGVLKDVDVFDGAGDGVRVIIISIGSFTESFIKIQQQEPPQDSTCHPSVFLESWRTWMIVMELS